MKKILYLPTGTYILTAQGYVATEEQWRYIEHRCRHRKSLYYKTSLKYGADYLLLENPIIEEFAIVEVDDET